MTTDNRTNGLTAEQILVDEWIRQADRAKSMTGMDAIWFPDAEETLAVLRANGLLSEGTPSEEHPEFCYCGQILKREDKIDFYTLKCPKLQCGGFRMVPKRSAGVASQEVIDDAADEQDDLRLHMLAAQEPLAIDPEKVAELIEQLRDRSRKERDVAKESLGQFIARALCEAYTEGKLT